MQMDGVNRGHSIQEYHVYGNPCHYIIQEKDIHMVHYN